jgi:signal transduction histidine kinase
VVLAASSLFAVWLEPSEPARHAGIAYSLLVAYLAYSIAVAAFSLGPEPPGERKRLLTHAFDLVFFSLFVYFTTGPASPFTTYFVFSLVCATVRWQWRGTLWTAVAAMVAFVSVGLYRGEVLQDPTFPLHSFIIRGVYLVVVAALLGYLGFHEQAARDEMSLLAGWRQVLPEDVQSLVREDLAYACRVLGCPRALLAWVESEEPWLHLASFDGQRVQLDRRTTTDDDPLVAPELQGLSFFCTTLHRARADSGAEPPLVWRRSATGLERWQGDPFPDGLPPGGARTALSCPLVAENAVGRVFFLDRPELTIDELTLGEVVAGVLAVRLEHFHFTRALALSAADQERVRLARDLHDGVLQSLTGIALQLAAARRRLDEDPAAAARSLEELRELIALEQRDLRFFIEDLRPEPGAAAAGGRQLLARLEELESRIEREWNLGVDLELADLGEPVPEALGRHVYLLVREAMVNAVRHGQATRVRVALARENGDLRVTVADNGRGFPVHGRFSLQRLEELNTGPRNIRERVSSLQGTLDLESTAQGARLVMTLPVDAPRGPA